MDTETPESRKQPDKDSEEVEQYLDFCLSADIDFCIDYEKARILLN